MLTKSEKKKLEEMIRHMTIHLPEKWHEEKWFKDGKEVIEKIIKGK